MEAKELDRLQRMAVDAVNRAAAASAAADKAKYAQMAEVNRRVDSELAVNKYLSQLVERQLLTGNVQPKVLKAHLQRFTGDTKAEYLRLSALLLSHPYSGVASDSTQIAGSTFSWQGKTYSLPELYSHLESLLGQSPMSNQYWFYDQVTATLTNRKEFRDDYLSPVYRARVTDAAKLQDTLTKGKVDYDKADITSDDMFLLQTIVDGQGYSDILS